MIIRLAVLIEDRFVTDGRTHGQKNSARHFSIKNSRNIRIVLYEHAVSGSVDALFFGVQPLYKNSNCVV